VSIDIKGAVKAARESARALFDQEPLDNLALEEVAFDDESNQWLVTLGYDSPHKLRRRINGPGLFPTIEEETLRQYKIFRIDPDDGHLISIGIRRESPMPDCS
jgi:hypothetical protein